MVQLVAAWLILGRSRFQFFELQFQLIDQPRAALGRDARLVAAPLGDLQLQFPDHRFRAGRPGARWHQVAFSGLRTGCLRGQFSAQSGDFMVAGGCAIGPKNRWRRRMSDAPLAIHTVGPEGFALMTGPMPVRDASASPGQGWPHSNRACGSAECSLAGRSRPAQVSAQVSAQAPVQAPVQASVPAQVVSPGPQGPRASKASTAAAQHRRSARRRDTDAASPPTAFGQYHGAGLSRTCSRAGQSSLQQCEPSAHPSSADGDRYR